MTNAELLANKLYDLRKDNGLSQEEFADKIGVSRQAVSKWERGEALPDTDNLITIAKLYGVSLDELISHTPTNSISNEKSAEPIIQEQTICDYESNDDTVFCQDTSIDCDNCKVEDSELTDTTEDNVNVKINLSPLSINIVKGDDVELDIEEEEEYYSYDDKPADKKRKFLRLLYNLPYPILICVAYLFWGFFAKDSSGWQIGWTLFITIPIYYSIIDCFRTKKLSPFCYPVFVAFVYCFIGMAWGLWHPYWILFITVPIYYAIAESIDR